jgi:hypothetical protein
MRKHLSDSIIAGAVALAGVTVISVCIMPARAQAPEASAIASASALRTPWGEPNLQGIWADETETPLQRPAKYANQEFFTATQQAELDKARAALPGKDKRAERGTELDVSGSYNDVFKSHRRTGARTSMIVDPPNGLIPPLTPEAQKINAMDQEFRLALMQATETCKIKYVTCNGGTYNPTPSPRRADLPPRYNAANVGSINRHDGPEDGALAERCLTGGLPEFGSSYGNNFLRIVQTPGGLTMFYDTYQGQGWQRNIVMDGSPHLPANIRQWYGDSRGHWEGNTLVTDVTNFSPKTDYQGSRQNLHLVERWTRLSSTTLDYVVTIEDRMSPWTVIQEFTKQSDERNRIYYEPRCNEGNFALPGLLRGARMEELAFAEGRGPDPATKDSATAVLGDEDDPLR